MKKIYSILALVALLAACGEKGKPGGLDSLFRKPTFEETALKRLGLAMNNKEEIPEEGTYKVWVSNDSACAFTYRKEGNAYDTNFLYVKVRSIYNKNEVHVYECDVTSDGSQSGSMVPIAELMEDRLRRVQNLKHDPKYQGMTEQQILEDVVYADLRAGAMWFGHVVE